MQREYLTRKKVRLDCVSMAMYAIEHGFTDVKKIRDMTDELEKIINARPNPQKAVLKQLKRI